MPCCWSSDQLSTAPEPNCTQEVLPPVSMQVQVQVLLFAPYCQPSEQSEGCWLHCAYQSKCLCLSCIMHACSLGWKGLGYATAVVRHEMKRSEQVDPKLTADDLVACAIASHDHEALHCIKVRGANAGCAGCGGSSGTCRQSSAEQQVSCLANLASQLLHCIDCS